jgi:putative SOS response-associated peptidase YedK
MCNLYEYDMTEEDMRLPIEHYKLVGRNWSEITKVYPNYEAPVVVDRVVETMRWGFPPPPFVKAKVLSRTCATQRMPTGAHTSAAKADASCR